MRASIIALCLLAIIALPARVLAQAFTYQGKLEGTSASTADLQFSLWNEAGTGAIPAGGTQIGATQTISAAALLHGAFSVTLNDAGQIGANLFDGSPRFLQLSVRTPSGGGSFTPLGPRQPILATPMATFANNVRGINIDASNHVGINTAAGTKTFSVLGQSGIFASTSGSGIALAGGAGFQFGGTGGLLELEGGLGGLQFTSGVGGSALLSGGAGFGGAATAAGGDATVVGGPGGSAGAGPGSPGGTAVIRGGNGGGSVFATGASGGDVLLRGGDGGPSMGSSVGATGRVRVEGNGGLLRLLGSNHAYIEFYTQGAASGRKGYIGSPGAGSNNFNIVNEAAGTLNLSGVFVQVNGTFVNNSDAREKHDIRGVTGALDIVDALRPVRYLWNDKTLDGTPLPRGEQIGFIAQEVEQVLPELVSTGETGRKAVSYIGVVPVLTAAVQDLRVEAAELRAENTDLRARLERLEQLVAGRK